MSTAVLVSGLVWRHVAMLRAVDAGRAEITASRVPDLFVDGLPCTDHAASALLADAGLVAPVGPAVGGRFRACLTGAGRTVLDETARPARPDAWQQNPLAGRVPNHPSTERGSSHDD